MYDDTKNKGTAVRKTDTWTTYEIRPQLIPKERKPYFCFCVNEIRLHKIIIVERNSFSVFVRPKNGHAKYFQNDEIRRAELRPKNGRTPENFIYGIFYICMGCPMSEQFIF